MNGSSLFSESFNCDDGHGTMFMVWFGVRGSGRCTFICAIHEVSDTDSRCVIIEKSGRIGLTLFASELDAASSIGKRSVTQMFS